MDYNNFLHQKIQEGGNYGFEPIFMPDCIFDFQKSLVEWSLRKGRSAIFADCGLGKSLMLLTWAQNVVQKTNGNVLVLAPLAVGAQIEREAKKFGVEAKRSRDGKIHSKIVITNYEMLHLFSPSEFVACVLDESSILKNFKGHIKQAITIFMRKMKYRLLDTATAAPNDFIELGTSSEALGYLGYMDMLGKFFKNDQNNCATNRRGRFNEATKWRLKGHAEEGFWRWVTSWARAIRKPSDLGFSDDKYILPELVERDIRMCVSKPANDMLFALPAVGLKEQRDERRSTIKERCEMAAELANSSKDFAVVWCNLNEEGDLLEKLIPDSVQVSGKDDDDKKEGKLIDFSEKNIRVMITKPKIGGFGLNWQHCNHVIFFPTHSYEQYYQAVRRCWRFGQKRNVNVDLIYTEGDENMIGNLKMKQEKAIQMFDNLARQMNNSLGIDSLKKFTNKEEIPSWL